MEVTAVTVPDEATVLEIASQAREAGMHIISNGQRTVLSPFVPPGWTKLSAVKDKNAGSALDAYEATDRSAVCCDMNEAAA